MSELVWVDIETTGLDPAKERILEIGLVVTDADLKVLARNAWLIGPLPDLNALDPAVVEMHCKSGLFSDMALRTSVRNEWDVAVNAHSWLVQRRVESSPMCGSSVHFDRAFLARHLSRVHDWFSCRNVDVSSIKELVTRWRPDFAMPYSPMKHHRALDDIDDSIEELLQYRRLFGMEPAVSEAFVNDMAGAEK